MRFWIVLALMAVLTISAASADVSCTLRNVGAGTCLAGEVLVFRMQSNANSHAAMWDQVAGNPWGVCCRATSGNPIGKTGSGILFLNATTNSHAWTTDPGVAIGNRILLSNAGGTLCEVDVGSCPAGFGGLASLSDVNNAHVADYTYAPYSLKFCCLNAPALCITPPDATRLCATDNSCCTPATNYCSTRDGSGLLMDSSEWHCCQRGYWWDTDSGLCRQRISCGLSGPVPPTIGAQCYSDILNPAATQNIVPTGPPVPMWFGDRDCWANSLGLIGQKNPQYPATQGCFNADFYGTPGYFLLSDSVVPYPKSYSGAIKLTATDEITGNKLTGVNVGVSSSGGSGVTDYTFTGTYAPGQAAYSASFSKSGYRSQTIYNILPPVAGIKVVNAEMRPTSSSSSGGPPPG